MFRLLDQSPRLARLIEALGNFLARQRGLPVVVGIVLVMVSLVVQLVNVFVGSVVLEIIGIVDSLSRMNERLQFEDLGL